jgi:hypothetical protein
VSAKNWHHFRENEVGDDVCTRCEVQVTLEAHMTFSRPCPTPPCPAKANPDTGCLFSPRRSAVSACVFCGNPGSQPVGQDELEDEIDAAMIENDSATGLPAWMLALIETAGEVPSDEDL